MRGQMGSRWEAALCHLLRVRTTIQDVLDEKIRGESCSCVLLHSPAGSSDMINQDVL